jgi:MerR family transcriptional regulator/heat shock protein HspR
MNADHPDQHPEAPIYGEDTEACYTLDVFAKISGVNSETILRYHEKGFLHPSIKKSEDDLLFDLECLRELRRIEHLRTTCEMNDEGLALLLNLLHEVEQLREERRQLLR